MRTIAVLNQKGGVGKTTSTVNMAAGLAKLGHKVAILDMDPQAHLTIHLGVNPETAGPGIYEVLTKSADINETLTKVRENLYLLGANINLVGAESELVSIVGREIILREAIETIKEDFDYLIIDCAPSLGLLTLNGLAAVNEVFIPLQPHFLALQGFGKLLQTVSLVSKRINPSLKVTGILFCMYDTRATLSSEVKTDIENFLTSARETDSPWSGAAIIPIHIRRNIKLAEAPSYGQTIFEYEPDCNGSYDYMAVADYVHNKMTKDGKHIAVEAEKAAKVEESACVEPLVDAPVTAEPIVQETVTEESVVAEVEQVPVNVPIVEVPPAKTVSLESTPEIQAIVSNDLDSGGNTSG